MAHIGTDVHLLSRRHQVGLYDSRIILKHVKHHNVTRSYQLVAQVQVVMLAIGDTLKRVDEGEKG